MGKDEEDSGVSEHKKLLGAKVVTDFDKVLAEEMSERLKEGFLDLFVSMPNKTLERFRGLLAGLPERS